MTLILTQAQLDDMRAHGESTYPEECIGILGGVVENHKRVVEVRRYENARTDSRHNRSLISPQDFLKLDREYRKSGLKMVAFYHSHPDHPAKPSEFDRENALPWHTYIIVKVDQGTAVAVTAWLLREDRSGFDSEEIEVAAAPGGSAVRG
jgi:proteasome lid subunit RPN8/RPN11